MGRASRRKTGKVLARERPALEARARRAVRAAGGIAFDPLPVIHARHPRTQRVHRALVHPDGSLTWACPAVRGEAEPIRTDAELTCHRCLDATRGRDRLDGLTGQLTHNLRAQALWDQIVGPRP